MMPNTLAQTPTSLMLQLFVLEAAFVVLFAVILLNTPTGDIGGVATRIMVLMVLVVCTQAMEASIIELCWSHDRPHWAATGASLLWVQLLSASDLLVAARADGDQLTAARRKKAHNRPVSVENAIASASAVGLLWNMRRVGTPWQIKNVSSSPPNQSRVAFIFSRIAVTVLAYLLVDFVVSFPPPDGALVRPDKAALFSLGSLTTEDYIFRTVMTISFWLITGVLNLFMTNMGAMCAVILGLAQPADCPPLYGAFSEAYTVRRFWGVAWHQMFRGFLTGHADLIVDNALPFIPRRSRISRYTKLAVAFFISGAIHSRADQLMGVPNAENGAIVFFLLQAIAIMMEDTLAPVFSAVLPQPLRRVLGWFWVLGFLVWSSPIWIYSSSRLGIDSAALLPTRVVGRLIDQIS